MISIIYPKDDFDAANVAVKVQALAQSRNQKVYVVPKHYGRNQTEIEKNLKKTSVLLFIAQSASEIDQSTIDEINILISKNKKVVGFLPDDLTIPNKLESSIILKKYHKGDTSELRNIVLEYLSEIQKNQNSNGLLIVLGLILFLFLLAFSTDD